MFGHTGQRVSLVKGFLREIIRVRIRLPGSGLFLPVASYVATIALKAACRYLLLMCSAGKVWASAGY